MNDLTHHFQEGGWSMYPIACFGFVGLFLGLAALASLFAPSRKFPIGIGTASMLIGLLALGMGILGTIQGRRATDEVIGAVGAEYAEDVRRQGYEESNNNLVFGGLACVLPLLAGMLAIGRGAMMKEPENR